MTSLSPNREPWLQDNYLSMTWSKSVLQTYAVMTNTFCEDKILESLDLGYWRLLRPAFEWPNLAMKKVTALPSRNKSAWVALMLYKDVQSIKCNVDARLIYHILKYKFHICLNNHWIYFIYHRFKLEMLSNKKTSTRPWGCWAIDSWEVPVASWDHRTAMPSVVPKIGSYRPACL